MKKKKKHALAQVDPGEEYFRKSGEQVFYALVFFDGTVKRELCSFKGGPGFALSLELIHKANLVIVRRGKKIVIVKDRYSTWTDREVNESQADWRIVQHINACLYGFSNVDGMFIGPPKTSSEPEVKVEGEEE
jgi:hypothetical protein